MLQASAQTPSVEHSRNLLWQPLDRNPKTRSPSKDPFNGSRYRPSFSEDIDGGGSISTSELGTAMRALGCSAVFSSGLGEGGAVRV